MGGGGVRKRQHLWEFFTGKIFFSNEIYNQQPMLLKYIQKKGIGKVLWKIYVQKWSYSRFCKNSKKNWNIKKFQTNNEYQSSLILCDKAQSMILNKDQMQIYVVLKGFPFWCSHLILLVLDQLAPSSIEESVNQSTDGMCHLVSSYAGLQVLMKPIMLLNHACMKKSITSLTYLKQLVGIQVTPRRKLLNL